MRQIKLTARVQYQLASIQPNGSNGLHLKKGAPPFNQEFRRVWFGSNIKMDHGLTFIGWGRAGGTPVRSTYSNGRTKKNYSYTNLFMLTLKKEFSSVKGLYVMGGKMMPRFSMDYLESSANNKCIERSLICNQYAFDSNWGLELGYRPKKNSYLTLQLLANDRANNAKSMNHSDVYRDGRGLKGEFGYEDKCFGILSVAHRFRETESRYHEISAQYQHDFNNAYNCKRTPGANNYGMQVKDALSLGYEIKRDKLLVKANIISNWEMQLAPGNNNIGWQLQSEYTINPHWDLVARYSGMTGRGACNLGRDRWTTRNTTAPSWVDSVHTLYLGTSFYYSAKNPNAAKLMLGAEYITARKGGADVYSGWNYQGALRFNF